MSSVEFDSVKIEKAKAIARYLWFRRMEKVLQIVEIIVALSLISWLSIRLPAVFKISGDYLLNHHAVFLIGNAIIIALFVLSRQNFSGNDIRCQSESHHQRVVESPDCESIKRVVSLSSSAWETSPDCETEKRVNNISSPEPETEETTGGDEDGGKQIVCDENAQCEAVASAIEEAKRKIRRFQRMQSEKLKREISVKSRRDLRRSESERREIVEISGERRMTMTSVDKVDTMSNEEFRLTVEAFIEKHQKSFKFQKNI